MTHYKYICMYLQLIPFLIDYRKLRELYYMNQMNYVSSSYLNIFLPFICETKILYFVNFKRIHLFCKYILFF